MKNYKNYLVALLTGLLALSLFTQPAKGAPAKATSPAMLIQYKHCLDLLSDTSLYDTTKEYILQFNQFVSLVVLNCATYKPRNVTDAKSLQYAKCLDLGAGLMYNLKVAKTRDTDLWEAGSVRAAISYMQEACKTYRP